MSKKIFNPNITCNNLPFDIKLLKEKSPNSIVN